jgi:hypothetical protein
MKLNGMQSFQNITIQLQIKIIAHPCFREGIVDEHNAVCITA